MSENAVVQPTPNRRNRRNANGNKPAEPVTLIIEADSEYVPWDADGKKHNTLKFSVIDDTPDFAGDGNDLFGNDSDTPDPLFKGNLYPTKSAIRAAMIAAGISTMPKTAHIAVTFTF